MSRLLDSLPDEILEPARKRAVPKQPAPMLATLTDRRFSDDGWIYERKLDGERCLALRDGKKQVRLLSRNGKDLGDTYPELTEALEGQPPRRFVSDGKIVAFDGSVTSFARLQARMQIKDPDEARESSLSIKVYYYIFDLLHLAGYDVTAVPLRHRKSLLRQTFDFADPIRFTAHRNASGEEFYEEACRKGWEGIIAKRANSEYVGFPITRLAQVQVRRAAGVRDRGLHRPRGKTNRIRRPAHRLLRRR